MATILAVEDDPDHRNLLIEVLTFDGFTVRAAVDLKSAMIEMAKGGVDLVLLDLMLPDVADLSGLEHMLAYGKPVVVLTGFREEHTAREVAEMGAALFIEKGTLLPMALVNILQHFVWQHARSPGRDRGSLS